MRQTRTGEKQPQVDLPHTTVAELRLLDPHTVLRKFGMRESGVARGGDRAQIGDWREEARVVWFVGIVGLPCACRINATLVRMGITESVLRSVHADEACTCEQYERPECEVHA